MSKPVVRDHTKYAVLKNELLAGKEVVCTRFVAGRLRGYFYNSSHEQKVHVVDSAWGWVAIVLVPMDEPLKTGRRVKVG